MTLWHLTSFRQKSLSQLHQLILVTHLIKLVIACPKAVAYQISTRAWIETYPLESARNLITFQNFLFYPRILSADPHYKLLIFHGISTVAGLHWSIHLLRRYAAVQFRYDTVEADNNTRMALLLYSNM